MTNHIIIFGVCVSAESYEGNTFRIKFVNASSVFSSISSTKIMLGGFPVSVYNDNEGNNVLGAYLLSSNSFVNADSLEYGNHFFYKGGKFYYKRSGSYNIWAFEQVDGSSLHEYDIPWYGANLSLNSSRELLFHIKSGEPDEIQVASVGGIPIPFARFGSNWHLVIVNDSGG